MNTSQNEIESKILEVSSKEKGPLIMALGGEHTFTEIFTATWLENVNGKEVRVRQEGEKVTTEFKGDPEREDGVKTCLEVGYEVDNYNNQIQVLKLLGFKEVSKNVKERTQYIIENLQGLGEVKFEFDTYSQLGGLTDIPEFLEIEALSKEAIYKAINLLLLNTEDMKDWGPGELIEHYKNKKKDS